MMKLKIGFMGSPYSGKTTTAAHVFAELKRLGFAAEFYPEYAREYIRNTRAEKGSVILTDQDQVLIAAMQALAEDRIMRHSGESVVLVTDGAALNAFFYQKVKQGIEPVTNAKSYDILFFSRNIEAPRSVDGNRLHDVEFSKIVDTEMDAFVKVSGLANIVELSGGVDDRVAAALGAFSEHVKSRESVQ
jgi:nicotinamide riboside kinase